MISVITINYNNLEGLKRTIESVFQQTSSDYEYIIIDGGSKDGSAELIEKHKERFSYWTSEPDGGIYEGMNKGISHATGKYCLFLNSGDEFAEKGVLEKVNIAINGEADFYVGSMLREDWNKGVVIPPKTISASYMLIRSLPHQSMFIRTELLKNNNFDTKYRIIADWEQQVREIVLNDATYRRLDFDISKFDVLGVSNTKTSESNSEREKATHALFSKSIIESLRGRDKLETKLLYSMSKDTDLQKGFKILTVALKYIWRGLTSF